MLGVDRFRRRSRGSRSRRREKPPPIPPFGEWEDGMPELRIAGERPLSADGARGEEGNGQNRQQINALTLASDCTSKNPVQLNTLAFEFTRGSLKKAGRTSIKMLIDQEMSKDMKSRRHSPSVVAKLMGLDTLPAQQPDSVRKESVSCLHKRSSEGFLGKHLPYDYEDPQEGFKDVFEVGETKITEEPGNWPVQKRLSKSRQRHKKMDYIRQKLMDAKLLSTDEKLQNSEQFSEALEVLESNKDLFLKLLQEPSSLFIKHLEEYRSAPTTPEASHILSLKSCNVTECENNNIHRHSEKKMGRNTCIKRNVADKNESDFVSHCIKEHNLSLSKRLLKNKLEGRTESSSLPTHIVVLKPSLENVREMICQENSQLGNSGYRRRRELRSGTWEMFSELREQQTLPDDVIGTQRTKGSREIAKEMSKHMMHTVTDGSVKSCGLGNSVCPRHKHSRRMPRTSTFMDFEMLRWSSDWLEKRHSSSQSTETSVTREARKHLSERWKMTHKFQEVGASDRGTSTLGEMLALSDREMPDMPLSSLPCQRSSRNTMSGKEVLARWGSPLGISSRDAWKVECSHGLRRSKSLPASSFIYGGIHDTSDKDDDNSMLKNVIDLGSRKSSEGSIFNERLSSSHRNVKICSNSSQHSNHVVDETKHHMCETNADQDEFRSGLDMKKLSEEKATPSEPKGCNNSDASYLVDCMPVVCGEGAELPCPTDEQQLPHSVDPTTPTDAEYSIACDQKENVTKAPSDELRTESLPRAREQACSPIVKMAEHPSPVSVLEPPDENESSPECFERVNADLQELRMQLQLLKSESKDTNAKDLVILVGEDADEGCDDVQAGGNQLIFKDDDNMEFCYLLDVLVDSGFLNADWDMLFSVCFLPGSPIGPNVFEKLEDTYSQFTWSRTERKLLFDLVNSILAEILAPRMDLHPWIKPRRIQSVGYHKHLADEVWQSLVRVRKDAADGPVGTGMEDMRWLDLGDDIDAVGRKIERMLNSDLLEELVSEIMLLDGSAYTCRHCGRNNVLSA